MKFSELLEEKYIVADLQSADSISCINELTDLFKDDPRITDLERAKEIVLQREKIMTTGVGKNFAVPHGKTDTVEGIICAFGRATHPIEFQSLDQQPVYLVMLMIGNDSLVSLHIKVLSRISRMMVNDEFREKLMQADTSKKILDLFIEEEKNYFEL